MLAKGMTMLLAGASAFATSAASAQTAATEPVPSEQGETTASGDIVVTARRVNETLSDVPASITAFGAEAIGQANIQRAQ